MSDKVQRRDFVKHMAAFTGLAGVSGGTVMAWDKAKGDSFTATCEVEVVPLDPFSVKAWPIPGPVNQPIIRLIPDRVQVGELLVFDPFMAPQYRPPCYYDDNDTPTNQEYIDYRLLPTPTHIALCRHMDALYTQERGLRGEIGGPICLAQLNTRLVIGKVLRTQSLAGTTDPRLVAWDKNIKAVGAELEVLYVSLDHIPRRFYAADGNRHWLHRFHPSGDDPFKDKSLEAAVMSLPVCPTYDDMPYGDAMFVAEPFVIAGGAFCHNDLPGCAHRTQAHDYNHPVPAGSFVIPRALLDHRVTVHQKGIDATTVSIRSFNSGGNDVKRQENHTT